MLHNPLPTVRLKKTKLLCQGPIYIAGQPLTQMLGELKYPHKTKQFREEFALEIPDDEPLVECTVPSDTCFQQHQSKSFSTTDQPSRYRDGALPIPVCPPSPPPPPMQPLTHIFSHQGRLYITQHHLCFSSLKLAFRSFKVLCFFFFDAL